MKVSSRIFGEIEIEDDKILTFESGLIGFEEYKKFAIVYDTEKQTKGGIMWLQSMEDPDLAFPIIDPMLVYDNYNPVVEDEWLKPIGDRKNETDIFVLSILTVPSDLTKMTANLKAPVIINTETRKACQIIVNNEEYEVRYNVYDYIEKLKKEAI